MKARKFIMVEVIATAKEKNKFEKFSFDFNDVQRKYMSDGTIQELTFINTAYSQIPVEKGPQILEITEYVSKGKIAMNVVAIHKSIALAK